MKLKSYLNILNIETKEETAFRLDDYEPIQERWSATNRYFIKKDEGYFNIWQIDRDHFAISFQPLMDWVKQIVVMYDFDGHLLDVMEVYGASRCITPPYDNKLYSAHHYDHPRSSTPEYAELQSTTLYYQRCRPASEFPPKPAI